MWLPTTSEPTAINTTLTPWVANALRCTDFVAGRTTSGYTKLGVKIDDVGAGFSDGACSFGIYASGGGTLLVSGTATCPGNTSSVVTVTGISSFGFTAGTEYRLCSCGVSAFRFVSVILGSNSGAAALDPYAAVTSHNGNGANACTGSAVLPATTGVLTTFGDTTSQLDGPLVYVTKE